MQLKYGLAYTFAVNGVRISTSSETVYDAAQVPYMRRVTAEVSGALLADGQAALTAASAQLEAALRIPYQDLVFFNDDGSVSATYLLNAGSLSGVTISRGPTFAGTKGWEYATAREFSFEARVDVPILVNSQKLLAFTESVEFSGGGPLYIIKNAIAGPMQRQLVYPRTPYVARQQGQAVGWLAYPTPPPPIWPVFLRESPNVSRTTPQRTGPIYQHFTVSWEYNYESVVALVGTPALWPLSQ